MTTAHTVVRCLAAALLAWLVVAGRDANGNAGAVPSTCNVGCTAARWFPAGSLSGPRTDHTATLLPDGRVLVTGGSDGTTPLDTAEIYDARTGTWNPTERLATARTRHVAVLLRNGKVLVAGGNRSYDQPALATAELYDPVTGRWATTGSMSKGRSWFAAVRLLDGRVLVGGGYVSDELLAARNCTTRTRVPGSRPAR